MTKKTATTKASTKSAAQSETSATAKAPIVDNTIVKVSLPWSQVEPAYQKALTHLSSHLKLDGFRKGHVPPKIAQEHINPEMLIEDTVKHLPNDVFAKAIEDAKVVPISQPELRIVSAQPNASWELEIVLAQKPEIDISSYKKVAKKAKSEAQKNWKEQRATQEKTEKSASATKSDKKKTTDKQADASEKLDSAESDDLAQRDFVLQAVYSALVTSIQPQIPELLVKQNAQQELEQLVRQLKQSGNTLDEYLAQTQQSFEDVSSALAARALGKLQLSFVLDAISADAKLSVTEAQVDAELKERLGAQATPDLLKDNGIRSYVQDILMQQAVANYLLSL